MSKPRRARSLAAYERHAERHAALVARRTGDPRFAQRTILADGSECVTLPPHVGGLFSDQRERFRAKFGRDIEPGDPVFFDPEADTPVPYPPEKLNAALLAAAEKSGDELTIALVRAAVEVGYFITDENEHLYSVQEIDAYEAAVSRYLDAGPEAEYYAEAIDELYDIVSALVDGDADTAAARAILDLPRRVSYEEDEDAAEAAYLAVLRCTLILLFAASRAGIDEVELQAATAWVSDTFGCEYAQRAAVVAIPLCRTKDPAAQQELFGKSGELTVGDLLDLLGDESAPAMIWLVAGLVATVGDGDVNWLRHVVHEALDDEDF
ncbi:hypothetical protein [Cryptosporangium aurantiacum]|nr:hypothetical protein [Cryptosporangium aurantiacum]